MTAMAHLGKAPPLLAPWTEAPVALGFPEASVPVALVPVGEGDEVRVAGTDVAESADAEDAAAADLEEAAEAEDMEAITESAKVVSGG